MKYLKMFGLAALAAALMALFGGTASATILESPPGTQLKAGTSISAKSEGRTELHPPYGSIYCTASSVGGRTTNNGGSGENVNGSIEMLTFTGCNATVIPLPVEGPYGTLSVASNGTLTGTGNEVTVLHLGFHCIYKTSNTKLGTVTDTADTKGAATLDIEATIPRTGGKSGAFCGSTAQWTGSYEVTSPNPLYIT